MSYFDFEKPILELLQQIQKLKERNAVKPVPQFGEKVAALEQSVERLQKTIYGRLTAWEKTLMARHILRPTFDDYVESFVTGFFELRGDRLFADEPAIRAGLGDIRGHSFMILGHRKGRTDEERKRFRYGQPLPEGFRKAMRVMKLAEKFGLPLLTLLDTPSADMGPQAEERGQAQTIARSLSTMAALNIPTIAVITGEGGSGGAIALALADVVMAQANAIYSVISPEGCAAIIYRDAGRAPEAAESLKITASHLLRFGVIDSIVPEPLGGAHMDAAEAGRLIAGEVLNALATIEPLTPAERIERRHERFRKLGVFADASLHA